MRALPTSLLTIAWLVLPACGGSGQQPSDARLGGDGASGSDAAAAGDSASTGDAAADVDPATDGTLAVTEQTVSIPGSASGRTVPATVYSPTGGPTPRPLVVISPGFQMARTQYASYAHHLATWGFVVVLTDYADTGLFADHQLLANDIPKVIDYALAQAALAVDDAKIATAGHSLGGDISVLAASIDHRVKAVVGWDPVDASNPSVVPEHMTGMTAAIAVIGETTDSSGGGMPCAPAGDNFQAFYTASPSPALQMTVAGADHMDWVDDPSCTFCSFCTAGSAPPDRSRTATRRLNVAWLRARLLGDPAMAHWLTAPPEVAAGVATVVAK